MEKLNKIQKERFFKDIVKRTDRALNFAMAFYFLFGCFLAFFYSTFFIAITIGAFSLAAYYFTRLLLPKSNLYQYVGSAVFGIFAAQFIYQMHGLFEMHFFVFVGSAVLIGYQNWKLQLPLIIFIVLHHASFAYLQYSGMEDIYFTQLAYMDLQTFIFHAGLAGLIVGICGFWAYDVEQKTNAAGLNTLVLEKQLVHMKSNINFAEEISKGNFNVEMDQEKGIDELGEALVKMKENLKQSSVREKEERLVAQGVAKIGEVIQKHNDNVQALSEEFVRTLVKYLKINQGGVFLLENEGNEEYLELTATYAFERKKFLKKKIPIGEGLVGQCFLEKDVVYLTEVPQDYVQITSGLGGANPDCILILPLMTKEETVGVLELVSFTKLKPEEISLVKKVCESVATSIVSSRITQKVKMLLEESQQQAEEMKAQEEEMRQNMEELQATQEELERKQREGDKLTRDLAIREKVLGLTIILSETDEFGTIQFVNEKFCQVAKYQPEELMGQPHNIVRHPDMPSALFELFWSTIRQGEVFKGIVKNKAKDGSPYWVDATIVPIKNNEGKIYKYVGARYHITNEAIAEELYHNQMKSLGLPLYKKDEQEG